MPDPSPRSPLTPYVGPLLLVAGVAAVVLDVRAQAVLTRERIAVYLAIVGVGALLTDPRSVLDLIRALPLPFKSTTPPQTPKTGE